MNQVTPIIVKLVDQYEAATCREERHEAIKAAVRRIEESPALADLDEARRGRIAAELVMDLFFDNE